MVSVSTSFCRVLLVEDTESNAMWALAALEHFGCDVTLVSDGASAARRAEESRYSIVLMDRYLPEVCGLEATRRIRDHEQQNAKERVPVVGVTAAAMPYELKQCMEAGMDAVLVKPFFLEQLEEVLRRWARPCTCSPIETDSARPGIRTQCATTVQCA